MAALMEIGGGACDSLEDGRSVFGLGALVTVSNGWPRTLDGVKRGEAEAETELGCLGEHATGEDVREGVLMPFIWTSSSSTFSCLTASASASYSISASIDIT